MKHLLFQILSVVFALLVIYCGTGWLVFSRFLRSFQEAEERGKPRP